MTVTNVQRQVQVSPDIFSKRKKGNTIQVFSLKIKTVVVVLLCSTKSKA
jgi:hypothetical protein